MMYVTKQQARDRAYLLAARIMRKRGIPVGSYRMAQLFRAWDAIDPLELRAHARDTMPRLCYRCYLIGERVCRMAHVGRTSYGMPNL